MVRFSNFFKRLLTTRSFSVEKGRIVLFKNLDWAMYPSSGLAATFQYVGNEIGKNFLFELGKQTGKDTLNDIKETIKIKIEKNENNIKEQILEFISLLGLGVPEIKYTSSNKSKTNLKLYIKDSSIIEESQRLYGKKSIVCKFIAGFFSYYIEVVTPYKNIDLKEELCQIKSKNDFCTFSPK